MGRLQRKKTIKKKKKKILSEDQRDSMLLESSKDSKPTLPTATFRPSKKDSNTLVGKQQYTPRILKKPDFIEKSIQFIREVKIELKKVTWPPRNQAISFTAVVLILVFIFAIYFGIVDAGLSALVRLVY
jgi:preprotein translocase subunit SecE